MLTLLVKGTPGEAASALITRGLTARPSGIMWPEPNEQLFNAPLSEERATIDWFCEEGSTLLWYSKRDQAQGSTL